ncbi:hypothetical protein [Luteimonas kalidii]|uniref:Type IV secretion system protein VirB5 n=1 Tax=Luteimonas kalidii TaxID=3042025 RepID=A0ABT6JWM8_9GAMM|nr:hypothetical protein [Luteimonas kalidii]MDH5834571.1 hypothetical protein [Luteimonas kalidii]
MNINIRMTSMLLLALSGACLAPAARAQLVVADPVHIQTNKFAWIAQYRQMYSDEINQARQIQNQIEQIRTQIQDLQEQQVNGLKFLSDHGPRDTNLKRRNDSAFLDERCGPLEADGLRAMLSGMTAPRRVSRARERQYEACAAVVQLDNQRHNFLVDVIRKVQGQDAEIAKLQAESASTGGNERGRLERNSNAIQQLQAAQSAEMENAQRQLQYYAHQIEAFSNEMAWSGQAAFSNKRSLLDHAVEYGTLKAALQVARSRDR